MGLVTDTQQLLELARTPDERKTEGLLVMLRRSDSGFLNKFIWCLRKSADGTAHGNLAQMLEEAQSKLRGAGEAERVGDQQHTTTGIGGYSQ